LSFIICLSRHDTSDLYSPTQPASPSAASASSPSSADSHPFTPQLPQAQAQPIPPVPQQQTATDLRPIPQASRTPKPWSAGSSPAKPPPSPKTTNSTPTQTRPTPRPRATTHTRLCTRTRSGAAPVRHRMRRGPRVGLISSGVVSMGGVIRLPIRVMPFGSVGRFPYVVFQSSSTAELPLIICFVLSRSWATTTYPLAPQSGAGSSSDPPTLLSAALASTPATCLIFITDTSVSPLLA